MQLTIKGDKIAVKAIKNLINHNRSFLVDLLCDSYELSRDGAIKCTDSLEIIEEN